jgi:hypothetical protein
MYPTPTPGLPPGAAGILGHVMARRRLPWAPLRRWRPVHPRALRKYLLGYHRLEKALTRHQQLFPEVPVAERFGQLRHVRTQVCPPSHPDPDNPKLDSDPAVVGWWQVLGSLLSLAEHHEWFEINWPALNDAWAWWRGGGENDSYNQGAHLAVFLDYIPLNMYGFNCQETIYEFPPMELFHALFARKCDPGAISARLLMEIELYDEEFDDVWGEADRNRAKALLDEIEANTGRYPEPVKWLPELIRWACHETLNPILDRSFDPHKDGPWFSWDEAKDVRYAWQRAQGVIKAFHRLMQWYEADSARLIILAQFLMEGKYSDELDW